MNNEISGMEIGLIERVGIAGIKVLIALFKKGELHIREIVREAGMSYTSLYRALHDLLTLKLIEEEIREGKRIIRLTAKGKELAELLMKAEELLKKE